MMKNIIGTDSFNEIKDVLLKKKCPSSGCPDGIPKSNAWIVWLSDKNGKITSMEVYERDINNPIRDEKIYRYVELHLEGVPYRDCGCVISDWDEWTLDDLLFKFGWQYGFDSRNTMIDCLNTLGRIAEFKDKIKGWMRFII